MLTDLKGYLLLYDGMYPFEFRQPPPKKKETP